jgi:threonine/homoserine/homoserine lactone efflux protein
VSIAFLVTTLVVVITPGTGVVYTLSAGLSWGGRAGVIAAVGCTLGIIPHMVATITGLAALLNASTLAFQVVKYLGVAYLLYMAWATLRDREAIVVPQETATPSATKVIVSAVLLGLLNPKLTTFFFAFLPQFVSVDRPNAVPRMAALSGVFMLLTFVVFAGYGVLAATVRDRVIARPRVTTWLRWVFAGSFMGLGVNLALAGR